MKQPTKKQLKEQIAELRIDLHKAINGLNSGQLKEEMVKKYPQMSCPYGSQWVDNVIKAYGDESYKTAMQILQKATVDTN